LRVSRQPAIAGGEAAESRLAQLRPRKPTKQRPIDSGSESTSDGDKPRTVFPRVCRNVKKSRVEKEKRAPVAVAAVDFCVGTVFQAKSKEEAQEWLKKKFEQHHQGGDITVRNSR
jgi:hypothetical protein